MLTCAGAAVFRQGDVGDALYIVYRGSVSVCFNGSHLDRRMTGEYFYFFAFWTDGREISLKLVNADRIALAERFSFTKRFSKIDAFSALNS